MSKLKKAAPKAALEPLSPRETTNGSPQGRGRGEGSAEAKRRDAPAPSSGAARHLLPEGEGTRPHARHSRGSQPPRGGSDRKSFSTANAGNPVPSGNHEEWTSRGFVEALSNQKLPRRGKLQARNYRPTGKFPVIDQGQNEIAGWTDDESLVIAEDLPYVVFGDHTRAFKYVDAPFALGADGTQLLKPSAEYCPRFFYYACLQLDLPSRGYNRHYTFLKEKSLPLPPKPEQQKIAAVLWKMQRAVATQDRLIAATRDLKQSAMQHLFTHGLRGEPLKDTEIGPIPLSWAAIKGAELFKLTSGSLRPKELSSVATVEKPYPVLGGNGVMGYADSFLIDQDKVIVIGRVGEYCGATHLASGKVWITDNALYVKQWIFESANADFVSQYLAHYDLNRFKRQAGQPLVTQGTINELLFALPATDEQRDIAAALATIDRKLAHHQRKRATLNDLFQTTLHQLMTAQIRVADLDIDTSDVTTPKPQGIAA